MSDKVLPIDELQSLSDAIRCASDAASIEALLQQVLEFYGVINFQFSYDKALWRGVLCDSERGHSSVHRVTEPPPRLTRNNRLNEKGRPVLYASGSQFAVLEEIGAKAGDFVHVVALPFQPDAKLKCCVVGEITQVNRWGRALLSEEVGSELNRILRGMNFDVGRSFVFTDSLLASLLRDPRAAESEYLRSRILARLLFAKIQNLEAIIYPSVAHEGAMNFAIQPSAARSKLHIGASFVTRIRRRYDFGIYDFEIVRKAKGHQPNGEIVWE
jgi:hypothetical protein